jgi:hypothetical protein
MSTAPWRAATLAPASIALTLFVVTVQIRMDDPWADGVLLLVALLPAALLLWEGLSARREDNVDRAATTALLVAGLALAALAIVRLGQALSDDDLGGGSGGTLVWMLLLFTALAAYTYSRSRAVAGLLIAALAAVGLLLASVHWVFQTEDFDVYRALLAVSFLVLFGAGLAGEGRPGTILIGAAGVTALVLVYLISPFILFDLSGGAGWGWELVMLVEGAALALYAVQQLEPGPGYLAFFVLVLFATSAAASGDDTLVGWPLALAVVTVLAAAPGLRAAGRAG